MEIKERKNKSMAAVTIGLGVNVLLAILKTSVGIVGHSPALLADGVNSTSDVAYFLVVGIFIRLAGKPPDHEHPYGHRQLESIAALVVGAFVITTAVAIFWNAIDGIYDLYAGVSSFQGAAAITLWVALFTVVVKIIAARLTRPSWRWPMIIATMSFQRWRRPQGLAWGWPDTSGLIRWQAPLFPSLSCAPASKSCANPPMISWTPFPVKRWPSASCEL